MTYREVNRLLESDETPTISEPLQSLVQAGFNHFKPADFEIFVLRIFEALNFIGSLTPATGDEGVDILLQDPAGTIIVQCKKYDDATKIGSKELREFLGAISHAKAIHGYFVTTTSFTDQAQTFCIDHENITLIDSQQLKRLFLFAILFSFDKFGRIHHFLLKDDTNDLGEEFRRQADDLYREYQRELEKMKENIRRRKLHG
jgi:restriction endonuclease Mrr